jgi:hypothetical protein
MEATLTSVTPRHRAVDKKLWTARILSSLALLFLLFDAVAKVLRLAPVMEASVRIGYPKFSIMSRRRPAAGGAGSQAPRRRCRLPRADPR